MAITEAPVGGTGKYLVRMNDNPFASFDNLAQAEAYVKMMRDCKKGGKKGDNAPPAFCAQQNWSIQVR